MKVSHVFAVVALGSLFVASGIRAQQTATANLGAVKTLAQKLDGVQAVELQFDERLSGYAVRVLTRPEARDRSGRPTGSPGEADARQQEARRIAEQFYAANLGIAPPIKEDKVERPAAAESPRYYDVAETGADFLSLTAIGSTDKSMILPMSRIAYIVTSEPTAD